MLYSVGMETFFISQREIRSLFLIFDNFQTSSYKILVIKIIILYFVLITADDCLKSWNTVFSNESLFGLTIRYYWYIFSVILINIFFYFFILLFFYLFIYLVSYLFIYLVSYLILYACISSFLYLPSSFFESL